MRSQILEIKGMHCASCAVIITKKLESLPHVLSVNVNYASEKLTVSFDENLTSINDMNKEINKLGYSLVTEHNPTSQKPQKVEEISDDLQDLKNKTEFIIPISLLVFFIMMWEIFAKTTYWMPNLPIPMSVLNIIFFILASIALFWVGQPYLHGVMRFIRYKVANMDTLIGIGTLTAYIFSAIIFFIPFISTYLQIPSYTYFDVTIVVIGFITLGKYLELSTKKKTGEAIKKLLNLQAKTAWVIRSGNEIEIPVDEVKKGDIIIIRPGVRIPVDGVVTYGESYIDESTITGEPMPVSKTVGDNVLSGTINTNGYLKFKATKVGSEALLSRIIKMVEEAQGSKAPIQRLADKISAVFVPTVLFIASLTIILWLTIGSYFLGFSQSLSMGMVSFVGVLIIACPCALGLATPTAIIVGVGKGANLGILIKDASTLEKLHKVNTVLLDKTGTITIGKPTLVDIQNFSKLNNKEFIAIIASLENKSEHPIAHAILTYAKKHNISTLEVSDFKSLKGRGVQGFLKASEYFAGNEKLISDLNINFDKSKLIKPTSQGKTPIFLANRKEVLGILFVADKIKKESVDAIKNLHTLGIDVIMLTGDDKRTAKYIASSVNIDSVYAQLLPQDKLNKIKKLQSQNKVVAMTGDGVNDAPALAQADVGIAMGTGTDVAIESAGITLLGGDLSKLVKAIKLSKVTMRGIKQNLFWAFIYNVFGIPLAAGLFYPIFGWLLNPVFAGFAMAMSSVSVVANSLRIKNIKI